MQAFSSNGRSWTLTLDASALVKIKDTLGIDLAGEIGRGCLETRLSNREDLAALIYALAVPIDSIPNLTAAEFGEILADSATLAHAEQLFRDALWQAWPVH